MAYRSPQKINQRLEHYVFSIASQFIDSADPSTQQALIEAAGRFSALISTDDAIDTATPNNVQLDLLSRDLDQTTDPRLAHRAWLTSWVQQQQQFQRRHIMYLEEALLITQQRYQLIQDTVLREPYRSRLLNRCQGALAHFQQCLDSAYTLTQSSTNWLSRLQHDKAV